MAVMSEVKQLRGYQRHITSEFLEDRYPYLEDINGHLKGDEVSMAKGDRLFPRLVEQLQEPGMAPEVLCDALCTITDMCSNQEQKCTAICSDVVAAATNLLMHESVPVRREAVRVIESLALLMGGRSLLPVGNTAMARELTKAVGSGPTLPWLAKLLLSCDDELVKRNVAAAYKAITVFRDGCQQVVDHGSVKSIAQYLCATLPDQPATKPLALCLLDLLKTLAAVTMYARDGVRDVFNCGLLEKVIRFLEFVPPGGRIASAPPEEACEIARQSLRFLWHCGNDQVGRKESLKAEGVRVITRYLKDSDLKVREAGICALNVIALETQGKKDVLQFSLEAIAVLLHSKTETAYLQEACVQLARGASELPAFRFAFARRVLDSIWLLEKVYGTTALAAVSPLLFPEEDAKTRTQAVKVTGHFLTLKGEPQSGDTIRVPPVSPSELIEEPALFALAECVDILHNLLGNLVIAREPALHCLDILTNFTRPREELRKVLASGRATAPEDAMPEIERMLAKQSAK